MARFDLVDSLSLTVGNTVQTCHGIDKSLEIYFYADRDSGLIKSIDLSDETALALLDTHDITVSVDANAVILDVRVDEVNQLLVCIMDSTVADQGWLGLFSYDAAGNITWEDDRAITISDLSQGTLRRPWVAQDRIYYGLPDDREVGRDSYQSGSFTGGFSTTSLTGPNVGRMLIDEDNGLLWAAVRDLATGDDLLTLYDISGGGALSLLDDLATPVDALITCGDADPDGTRDAHIFYCDRDDFIITRWDGASLSERSRITPASTPRGLAISDDGTRTFILGFQSPGSHDLLVYDTSDVDAVSLLESREGWKNAASPDIDEGVDLHLYRSDSLAVMLDRASDFVAVFSTGISPTNPPDTPTITVESRNADGLGLSGSAYSHPDGTAHDSSKWELDEMGGDFSSPFYNSGFINDLESHRVPESSLTSPGPFIARVTYKDALGEEATSAASDPVAVPGAIEPTLQTEVPGFKFTLPALVLESETAETIVPRFLVFEGECEAGDDPGYTPDSPSGPTWKDCDDGSILF